MVFSSLAFLYYFLPILMIVYFTVPRFMRNGVLLLGSLAFYFYGEPIYTILLVVSSVSDFYHSRYIEKHAGTSKAKWALGSSIAINLFMLGFFKYADFIIASINTIAGTDFPLTHVPLPIGISFFTFQTMSYTIDVYRGKVPAADKMLPFATFVTMFPQLVAGPIVRYEEISERLHYRKHDLNQVASGISRFLIGLSKKVLLANQLGELVSVFELAKEPSVLFYWTYAVAFSLQIYFDFSGYSDMAIGLGKILGFKFPENFDYPFTAQSITVFWRKWHMTLGSWFRDYVYFPLGGNRVTKVKWVRNIFVVWALTGLWHGAAWNFVIWGIYFGVLLILEKLWLKQLLDQAPRLFRHLYVILATSISFVLFDATNMAAVIQNLSGMFGVLDIPLLSAETGYQLQNYGMVLLIAAIGSTSLPARIIKRVPPVRLLEPVYVSALLVIVTAYLVDGSFNPFLYFRF